MRLAFPTLWRNPLERRHGPATSGMGRESEARGASDRQLPRLAHVAVDLRLPLLSALRAEERHTSCPARDEHGLPTTVLVATRCTFLPELDGSAVLADDYRTFPRDRPSLAGRWLICCIPPYGRTGIRPRDGRNWLVLRR